MRQHKILKIRRRGRGKDFKQTLKPDVQEFRKVFTFRKYVFDFLEREKKIGRKEKAKKRKRRISLGKED